jgi:predicted peroxiredoxin
MAHAVFRMHNRTLAISTRMLPLGKEAALRWHGIRKGKCPNFKEIHMAEQGKELVVIVTHGIDHELSSVAFTIANGGITAGMKVAVFLTSAGVDVVRKKASDSTHVKPLDPLADLVRDFVARGGALYACTPCVKSRGYEQNDFVEGVTIAGSSVIHERFLRGAASLSF